MENVRKQGKGESRDWYQFIRGGKSKSLNYSETIKVEGKSVMGYESIKGEIENFWGKIG